MLDVAFGRIKKSFSVDKVGVGIDAAVRIHFREKTVFDADKALEKIGDAAIQKFDGVSAGAGVIDNLDFFHDAFCSCSCSYFSFTKIRMAPAASLYSIIADGENLSRTATGFNEILSY